MQNERSGRIRLVEGGALRRGDRVLADERPAVVVCADFRTHVFRGEISVLHDPGERALLPEDRVRAEPSSGCPQGPGEAP